MNNDRLTAFLYDLMRDELPTGKVERLVIEAEKISSENRAEYCNKGLAMYAAELAERLLGES